MCLGASLTAGIYRVTGWFALVSALSLFLSGSLAALLSGNGYVSQAREASGVVRECHNVLAHCTHRQDRKALACFGLLPHESR